MPLALKEMAFTLMGWVLTPLGLALAWAARSLWRRVASWRASRRWLGRSMAVLLALVALVSFAAGAVGLWVRYRAQPSAAERQPFAGISYRRFAREDPRPIVVHVATVDLDAPGISLVPTPDASEGCLPARTTSTFVHEYDVQLAINAQFFFPCPGKTTTEEFVEGELQRPAGIYVVDGEPVVERRWRGNTIYVAADGTVTLYEAPQTLHHAISGRHRLVEHGRALAADDDLIAPRVAVGFDASRREMTLVIVDGRQRGYSEGVTLGELATLLVELGTYDAIELDGGGSATMVIEGEDGRPEVLNSPIHGRIPGRERPVANHLGVRALAG